MAPPPNCPGGKLMLCTTSMLMSMPCGLSSQLGEEICVAPASTPSSSGKPRSKLVDSQAIHPVAKCPESDTEQLRRGGAVEARLLERLEDGFLLNPVEVVRQGPLRVGQSRLAGQRDRRGQLQVLRSDLVVCGERDGPLQDVLQLPRVSRKIVSREGLFGDFGQAQRTS